MAKYKPNYDGDAIKKQGTQRNVSGESPQTNLFIEESAQRSVAESSTWLLARKHNMGGGDTRPALEALGFIILGEEEDLAYKDDLFYKVEPPKGWTKETSGYWTIVKDASGDERISQFFKGAWYDRDAFLNIR